MHLWYLPQPTLSMYGEASKHHTTPSLPALMSPRNESGGTRPHASLLLPMFSRGANIALLPHTHQQAVVPTVWWPLLDSNKQWKLVSHYIGRQRVFVLYLASLKAPYLGEREREQRWLVVGARGRSQHTDEGLLASCLDAHPQYQERIS